MSLGYVSTASIVGMIFSLCMSIGLPVALLIFCWRKKAGISSFFIGAAIFIVFALILEQILHAAVLGITGTFLTDHIWLYALYGGVAAALFEETGRWVAMKYFMRDRLDVPNALMYGAGHGGAEAILLVGLTNVNNLISVAMINGGTLQRALDALDDETASASVEQISVLWTTPAYQFYLGGIERVLAIILQIALSVLVYLAVKNGRRYCWGIAFAAHFLVDFVTIASARYLPLAVVELLVALMTAVAVALTVRLCRKEEQNV